MQSENFIAGSPPWLRGILYGLAWVALLYLSAPGAAHAEACLCVCDPTASQVRVCDTVTAAQADIAANTNTCPPRPQGFACPDSPGFEPTAYVGALPEGATDCETSQVYIGKAQGFVAANLCGVVDVQTNDTP